MIPIAGGTSGAMTISNNTIGSVSVTGAAGISTQFFGIQSLNSTGSYTISNNTVGGSTGNSIISGIQSTTTAATTAYGIFNVATGNISITGNTIRNLCSYGDNGASILYGVYNIGAAASLSINSNTFTGNTCAATSGFNPFINIYNIANITGAISITGNTINSSIFSASATSGNYYMIKNIGSSASLIISSNVFSNIVYLGATGGTGELHGIYNTGVTTTETISGNNFNNLTGLKTVGSIYLIYNSYTAPSGSSKTIQNNVVTTAMARSAIASTGAFTCYFDNGSSPSTTHTISGNVFSNINTNSTGTGNFYGIRSEDMDGFTRPVLNVYNNTISNILYAGTGSAHCLYLDGFGGTVAAPDAVYNNTISGIIGNSASSVSGINVLGGGSPNVAVYGNNVNTFSGTGTPGSTNAFRGIFIGNGANMTVAKNKLYDISGGNSVSTVFGIYIADGVTVNVQNNLIGNLSATAANNQNAVSGIYIGSSSGNTANIYFNTVYLSANSTGTNFGTSGVYASTLPTVNMRNNIIINNSTPAGTGITAAYRRSSSTTSTYASTSNNNLLYAGSPGAQRLIYVEGTTSTTNGQATLSNYKSYIGTTKEANSVTENSNFVSLVGSNANFLRPQAATATLIESHAVNISGITDDYSNVIRQGNTGYAGTGIAPDLGALEGNFVAIALPITIVDVAATKSNGDVNVSWDVENEKDTRDYEVERSIDGQTFVSIGQVAQQGKGHYELIDPAPNNGNNFYRIKATEFSGNSFLSRTVNVVFEQQMEVTTYPNPASDFVKVHFGKAEAGSYRVALTNTAGQLVANAMYSLHDGENGFNISIASLAPTVYQLQILNANGQTVYNGKLIKQ